jgi:hypothetical protein
MKTVGVALLALLLPCSPTQATDLGRVDRTIRKEPAYQSRQPRYGLLVLGPKAETRLWLVFDSVPDPLRPGKARDYLYVDRNGNGDLTEPGERVEAVVRKRTVNVSFKPYSYEEPLLEFAIGDVQGHKAVKVMVEWYRGKERPATISATSGGRPQDSGAVVFAASPKDAPVVHIGGRLTFGLQGSPTFERGKERELYVYLGTPGLGDGTFATLGIGDVPRELHPVVEIGFPGGGPPVKVVLRQRC